MPAMQIMRLTLNRRGTASNVSHIKAAGSVLAKILRGELDKPMALSIVNTSSAIEIRHSPAFKAARSRINSRSFCRVVVIGGRYP